MAAVTPNGKITLCHNVPLSNNYAHSIYFADRSAQNSYFGAGGIAKKDLLHQNYVKTENGKIRVEADSNELDMVNYMWWENGKIDNDEPSHRVYAFVTNIDYISPNVSEITYEVDVLQTYVIDEDIFGECLIERQTVSTNETPGSNLEPESISIGDKIFQNREAFKFSNDYENFKPVMWTTFDVRDIAHAPNIKMTGMGFRAGIFQGLFCTVFDNFNAFEDFFDMINDELSGWTEEVTNYIINNIVAITAVPKEFVKHSGTEKWGKLDTGINPKVDHTFDKCNGITSDLAGIKYENIRYKKLFTYPYNGLYLTNNDGNTQEFRYEFFEDKCIFTAYAAVQPNFEIVAFPVNYAGASAVGDKAISLSGYPLVPWVNSAYKQWLANSQYTYGSQATNMLTSVLAGALIGSSVGTATTAAGIAKEAIHASQASRAIGVGLGGSVLQMRNNYTAEERSARQSPNIVHQGSATAKTVANLKGIVGYQHCLNKKDVQRIDDYFSEFGYAINRIKKPSVAIPKGRNQKYIKTCGCMVKNSNCPAEFARRIENIFNSGITWWKSNKIGVYN